MCCFLSWSANIDKKYIEENIDRQRSTFSSQGNANIGCIIAGLLVIMGLIESPKLFWPLAHKGLNIALGETVSARGKQLGGL